MSKAYTNEKQAQILISLMKAKGIKKVIASPGTTNMAFIGSIQHDSFFEIFSCVDERSAAYMACGLAAESGEVVALSCTGATASRNYIPGLTEAFYRKLPVLAITSTQMLSKIGHHVPQVIDRSVMQKDVARYSIALPIVKDDEDFEDCVIKVNTALHALTRAGGGPVHINLPTTYSRDFSIKELPKVRCIDRFSEIKNMPELKFGSIGIFVGSHRKFTTEEVVVIEKFCECNNAVVFCDHTSNYYGRYKINFSLYCGQEKLGLLDIRPDLLIHIGEISGDYYTYRIAGKEVWRINPDGEIRDTFGKLRSVFEMEEQSFFEYYTQKTKKDTSYYNKCLDKLLAVRSKIPELPFSNVWLAQKMSPLIPKNSVVYFGILNSLRSWNLFDLPLGVSSSSNVGGFGIDGGVSSLIGASLFDSKKIYFMITGDLSFFYDINVLGSRHVKNNVRILLINNGRGTEFRQYNHPGALFNEEADAFIAAAGHFGNKSVDLVRNFASNLGFEYMSASNKEEFLQVVSRFTQDDLTEKPMVLEVFTESDLESKALEIILNIEKDVAGSAKEFAKAFLSKDIIKIIKKNV